MFDMRRREFITLLGGAATAWPLAARAQQGERMRRIGVLMHLAADDPESPTRIAALRQGLQHFGWADGGNLRIDYRWAKGESRSISSRCQGIDPTLAGCPCGQHQPRGTGAPSGNSHVADCLHQCRRSGWRIKVSNSNNSSSEPNPPGKTPSALARIAKCSLRTAK